MAIETRAPVTGVLAKVLHCAKFGWSLSVQNDFKPCSSFCSERTTEAGYLMWVDKAYCLKLVEGEELHSEHPERIKIKPQIATNMVVGS